MVFSIRFSVFSLGTCCWVFLDSGFSVSDSISSKLDSTPFSYSDSISSNLYSGFSMDSTSSTTDSTFSTMDSTAFVIGKWSGGYTFLLGRCTPAGRPDGARPRTIALHALSSLTCQCQ